ncbi:unnamed protein product [Soboliphyme baturini]|uniref:Uncharacterized protein n=1 Tax=Soboliphyme baturini TaxID=241478 RepID=A0A183I8U2_9BILA|nr:unnamed protein product [Soboliphyme baturini]
MSRLCVVSSPSSSYDACCKTGRKPSLSTTTVARAVGTTGETETRPLTLPPRSVNICFLIHRFAEVLRAAPLPPSSLKPINKKPTAVRQPVMQHRKNSLPPLELLPHHRHSVFVVAGLYLQTGVPVAAAFCRDLDKVVTTVRNKRDIIYRLWVAVATTATLTVRDDICI